jgi:hypothetical protein
MPSLRIASSMLVQRGTILHLSMFAFEHSAIWATTLARQPGEDPFERARRELRNWFLGMRERAATLAQEIGRDQPQMTIHDLAHIDALWGLASIIAGPEFEITPTEAFVLGGAFLVHDLAMSLASYPEGTEALRKEEFWLDSVSIQLRKKLGRVPLEAELEHPGETIETQATEQSLRFLHARQAERLTMATFKGHEADYHLVDNPDVRTTFGPIIGRIAHSHWWSVDRLKDEFAEIMGAGALAGIPSEWQVDPLKLAALLRVADASHLDQRRAPGLLLALRKVQGISKEHWTFQNKLLQPRLEFDRLKFTSQSPFPVEDAEAWWLCFDLLRVADRELRRVDDLLADMKRPRFVARSVAYIDSPERLGRLISTQGWLPVEATVKVSNVVALARNIGGQQLYGENRIVPLRELIQNASDAIRARRVVEGRSEKWGQTVVCLGTDQDGNWLEVQDSGIGMSVDVLIGPLLDFGTSYWGSDLMREEHPGLLSKGFQSSGQYGIGFFSVFMLGDHVRITTRRPEDAKHKTHVLEFKGGLETRPLLRDANASEQLLEPGTSVRVWLKHQPDSERGLLTWGRSSGTSWKLDELCAWLCPSLDVDIYTEQRGRRAKALSANDWVDMAGPQLMKRLALHTYDEERERKKVIDTLISLQPVAENYRVLTDEHGKILGRAAISLAIYGVRESPLSVVTSGGLRAEEVNGISGVLVGVPSTATREIAIPVVKPADLARWASEQATLARSAYHREEDLAAVAATVIACAGDPPIAKTSRGWISLREVSSWANKPRVLISKPGPFLREGEKQGGKATFYVGTRIWPGWSGWEDDLTIDPGVLVIPERRGLQLRSASVSWPLDQTDPRQEAPIKTAVILALAQAWSLSTEDLLRVSTAYEKIGLIGSEKAMSEVLVLVNPH